MEKVYALLLGAVIGGAWISAALAILLSMLKRCDAKAAAALAAGEDKQEVNRKTLNKVLRFFVSKNILDVLLFLVLFLIRGWLPFNWVFVLLGVAVMMTIVFQILLNCTGITKRLSGKK